MTIDVVTKWWDRSGSKVQKTKINEIIAAINDNISAISDIEPIQSVVAILYPFDGADWFRSYGLCIRLDGFLEMLSWSAGIPAGFSRWRYTVHYRYSQSGISLNHYSRDNACGSDLAWNRQDDVNLMYPFIATNDMMCYSHGWYALTGNMTNVAGQIMLNNSSVWAFIYVILVEFDKGSV